MTLFETLRAEAQGAPESGIVAVMNHGRGRDGMIPLWAGEGDLPTPAFISDAASRALAAGETFYTWQKGIPELRHALADYYRRHFGRSFSDEEFIVTGSGMHAIQLAVDALAVLGDHLGWHGGITLDYLHVDGRPAFIECNPRTVEPGNAWAAGVDLPGLTITLAQGGPLPPRPQIARPGIRTRSTMAIALGTAEARGTRRAILSSIGQAVATRGVLHGSTEVLTPALADLPSLIPFGIATGTVLTSPSRVATLAAGTVETYAVTPAAVDAVRRHAPTDEPAP